MLQYAAHAWALVHSSDEDGFAQVLTEAMSVGCPVVTADSLGGGPRFVTEDGKYGLLVPRSDPAKLAEAMGRDAAARGAGALCRAGLSAGRGVLTGGLRRHAARLSLRHLRPEPPRPAAVAAAGEASAALMAMPNIPILSPDGQMMVAYSGCFLGKVANPSCVLMSSTSITPPGVIALAACSISNTTFAAVCRLSWMNTPAWPILGDQPRKPLLALCPPGTTSGGGTHR